MKKIKLLLILVFLAAGISLLDSCKKDPKPPTLTTSSVSNITVSSATSGGDITSDGGAEITSRGLCWGTTTNPDISGSYTSDGEGAGSFVSNLTGLTSNTLYHIRAYATNEAGTSYGEDLTFTTIQVVVPTLTTTEVTFVTTTTAVSGGNITSDGNAPVTARGLCWSTAADPTINDPKTSDGTGIGSFVSNLTGLTPGTIYHVRAYATNSAGTAYGADVTFTATALALPSLTTAAVTALTEMSAVSGGNITNDNGAEVTARGICWGTTTAPTTAGLHTSETPGTGVFTSNMTGLLPGTTYYVRAYATNSVGTEYGNELTFTTLIIPATLSTNTPGAITQTTAVVGGNITSDGGSDVTARGTCWSTTADPTISGSHTTDATGVGSFTSNLTGLTSGTTYHVRAYATTSAGTAYGQDLTFTTNPAGFPVLTTTALTGITLTDAVTGGNITDDGASPITDRGVCWGTTANPTISGSHTTDGSGIGSFPSNLTGLTEDMTYYVRAYATNTAGTSYGNEFVFHTDVRDREDNTYDVVLIGSQVWMGDNLKTASFSNGDAIPTTLADITAATNPIYQWAYNNDNNNIAVYGRLYTWAVASDPDPLHNVCPTGWHVPTDAQLESMKTFLGGEEVAGGKLKETGTSHWDTPNAGATNETGFTAVASGYRFPNGDFASGPGTSGNVLRSFYIWSSSPGFGGNPWGQGVSYSNTIMLRGGYIPNDGVSIRCLKD